MYTVPALECEEEAVAAASWLEEKEGVVLSEQVAWGEAVQVGVGTEEVARAEGAEAVLKEVVAEQLVFEQARWAVWLGLVRKEMAEAAEGQPAVVGLVEVAPVVEAKVVVEKEVADYSLSQGGRRMYPDQPRS